MTEPISRTGNERRLLAIRLVHTAVWAVFAGAIVAIFPALYLGSLRLALLLSLLVWVEVLTFVLSGWHCPLRIAAARLTDDHADGFDIFLPAWLARNNVVLFGTLFAVAEALLLWMWLS